MRLTEGLSLEIGSICPIQYRRGRDLTTIQTGDGESLVAYPRTVDEVSRLLAALSRLGLAWRAIGNGSNCIIADEGVDIVLISLNLASEITVHDDTLRVSANFSMMQLARLMVKQQLAGLEFMAGIPGTVGGGVVMNAGAHGSEVCEVLDSVEVVTAQGVHVLNASQLEFAYRHSILQDAQGAWAGAIVVAANFKLEPSTKESILGKITECLQSRRKTQPLQYPSFGSVFRNLSIGAWKVIDDCGLRGHQIGGCEISTMHPNWIVNPKKDAKSVDVVSLIQLCKERAQEIGYQLQSEVKLLGC